MGMFTALALAAAGGTQVKTSGCTYRGELPDPACTPGAVATRSAAKVCRPGYARSVRPSSSESHRLKVAAMRRYGRTDSLRHYQGDHLVSLELGGAPRAASNVWPQPVRSAHRKDRVENHLHGEVCSGRLSLRAAQRAEARDWTTVR